MALAIDMEDDDLAFHDNNCTATCYTPPSKSKDSHQALVPSSILWMEIAVE